MAAVSLSTGACVADTPAHHQQHDGSHEQGCSNHFDPNFLDFTFTCDAKGPFVTLHPVKGIGMDTFRGCLVFTRSHGVTVPS